MNYALVVLLSTVLIGCSAAGGPPGDNDRWLIPAMFSLLFTAMFKFAEVVIKWWRDREHRPPPVGG